MDLICPTCQTPDLDADQMCDDKPSLCLSCCLNGEHHWMPRGNDAA